MNAADVREALRAALEANFTNVQIWPYLVGTVPATPAIIIRRNGYQVTPRMGAPAPDPSFDLICVIDMATEGRPVDLDEVVSQTLQVLLTCKDLGGAHVKATTVGDEEEFIIGGQSMLGCPITVTTTVRT